MLNGFFTPFVFNIPSQEFLSNGAYLRIQLFFEPLLQSNFISLLHFSSADGTRNSFHHLYGMYWFTFH